VTGIVVTGGTGGIGQAVVKQYADVGVVCSYREDADGAAILVDATDSSEGQTAAHQLDVTDLDSVDQFATKAQEMLDTISAVIHTVGIVDPALLDESTDEQFGRDLETNIAGTARVARAFLPALREAAGSLVVLSSIGGTAGTVDTSYAASKAGLHGFTRALAREVGPNGVCVNALVLGPVDASLNNTLIEYLEPTEFLGHEGIDTHLPEYRCAPVKLARSIAYLVDSEFTHGKIHCVNGGMRFR
jgi:3-oxoacyl-[acyl-carrier protein] reductase